MQAQSLADSARAAWFLAAPAPTPPPGGAAPLPAASVEEAYVMLPLTAAVSSTLRHHPNLARAQSELNARSAEWLAARAAFDPQLTAGFGHTHATQHLLPSERMSSGERTLSTDTTTLGLGANTTLAWGTRIAPSIRLERVSSSYGEDDSDRAQRARVDLSIIQPLLRGRGETAAMSELRAAEHVLRAARYDSGFAAQSQVFEVILAYYNFVAAHETQAVFRASLRRELQLHEETRLLVASEQRTRADLSQVQASLNNQQSLLFQADSDLQLAQAELALAMGLDLHAPQRWSPADPFPDVTKHALMPNSAISEALASRKDLQAARERSRSATVLVAGAERNALPALDLTLGVGYVGTSQHDGPGAFFAAIGQDVPGLGARASLELQLPLRNDAARAQLMARRAAERSVQVTHSDLSRHVRSGVRSATRDLQLSAAALGAADSAATVLRQLVQDERDKLREGLATIIDVVLTEERLTQAELTRIARRLRYTGALARLQFERGKLPDQQARVAHSAAALLELGGEDG